MCMYIHTCAERVYVDTYARTYIYVNLHLRGEGSKLRDSFREYSFWVYTYLHTYAYTCMYVHLYLRREGGVLWHNFREFTLWVYINILHMYIYDISIITHIHACMHIYTCAEREVSSGTASESHGFFCASSSSAVLFVPHTTKTSKQISLHRERPTKETYTKDIHRKASFSSATMFILYGKYDKTRTK